MKGIGYQKNLLTGRWNKVAEPSPKESQIQISLIQHLKLLARKDVLYFHCPNGELRNKVAAAKLKAMGVLPGVSDLLFFWKHTSHCRCGEADVTYLHVLCLELKSLKGKQTEEQEVFQGWVERLGMFYECADTIDGAIAILNKYGLLRGRHELSGAVAPSAQGTDSAV